MARTRYDLDTCMDIFDWFDTEDLEYIYHIMVSKLDGEERINKVLPYLRKRAQWLVKVHRGSENAYPEDTAA